MQNGKTEMVGTISTRAALRCLFRTPPYVNRLSAVFDVSTIKTVLLAVIGRCASARDASASLVERHVLTPGEYECINFDRSVAVIASRSFI